MKVQHHWKISSIKAQVQACSNLSNRLQAILTIDLLKRPPQKRAKITMKMKN